MFEKIENYKISHTWALILHIPLQLYFIEIIQKLKKFIYNTV